MFPPSTRPTATSTDRGEPAQYSCTAHHYSLTVRYDPGHQLLYCENFKVGSSTWAVHLLGMTGRRLPSRAPVHSLLKQTFPPLLGTVQFAVVWHCSSAALQ